MRETTRFKLGFDLISFAKKKTNEQIRPPPSFSVPRTPRLDAKFIHNAEYYSYCVIRIGFYFIFRMHSNMVKYDKIHIAFDLTSS